MRGIAVVCLECARASSGERSLVADLHKRIKPMRAPRSASSPENAECKVRPAVNHTVVRTGRILIGCGVGEFAVAF